MNNKRSYLRPVENIALKDYEFLIQAALEEDKVKQDITSLAIFSEHEETNAVLIAKDEGVLAGIQIFQDVFRMVDETVSVELKARDGDILHPKDEVAILQGNVISILTAERTALNFLSMVSGIANSARKCATILSKMNIHPLDTRKTLPGYRMLSKYAVHIGGGWNHRTTLEDMGLIKDNHIAAAGGVIPAIKKFKEKYPEKKLEVEVETLAELEEALGQKPDMILLDNMSPQLLSECSKTIREFNKINNTNITSEASGGFHPDNLEKLENTGVDFVSMGALTNRITPFDFSLEIKS